jgi:hypothetical protein
MPQFNKAPINKSIINSKNNSRKKKKQQQQQQSLNYTPQPFFTRHEPSTHTYYLVRIRHQHALPDISVFLVRNSHDYK